MKINILKFIMFALLSVPAYSDSLRENTSRNFNAYTFRVESLTYVSSDDTLWQSNDHKNETTGGIDTFTLQTTQVIQKAVDFYGHEDRGTTDKNYKETETIASDGGNKLYVVNTVNNQLFCGGDIKDLATIYKLERPSSKTDFVITDWHLLPSASQCPDTPVSNYAAMVVINGEIYFGGNREVYLYDYNSKEFHDENTPALTLDTTENTIRDMAYDGTYLWIIGYDSNNATVIKIDWKSKLKVKEYEIYGLVKPRGIAVSGKDIYVGENDNTLPNIHVYREPL